MMFIPSETVAFLPTKNDPDACAVCVKGQPHKGTHREDLPHAMCDAAYGRLCQIVAGERKVGKVNPRKKCSRCKKVFNGVRKTCERCTNGDHMKAYRHRQRQKLALQQKSLDKAQALNAKAKERYQRQKLGVSPSSASAPGAVG